MCATLHSSQARKPVQLQPPELGDRALAADGGERAEVAVAERRAASCRVRVRASSFATYSPCCLATGATPGSGLPSASGSSAVSPMTKTSGWPGTREIGRDDDAAGAIGRGAEPVAGRRGHDAGGPDDGARLDALGAERDAVGSRSAVTGAPSRTSTPSCSSDRFAPPPTATGANGGSRRGPASTSTMRALRGSMVRKSAGERALGELGDGAGHLDAGRAAADDDEGQQARALGGVGLGLGALEGEQDAAAQLGRVVDRLQARARRPPSRRGRNRRGGAPVARIRWS